MSADEAPADRHAAMTWAQRLKRVFKIDIETCETCGGKMQVIAAIEAPAVIKRSWRLSTTAKARGNTPSTHPRAPPPRVLPGLMK